MERMNGTIVKGRVNEVVRAVGTVSSRESGDPGWRLRSGRGGRLMRDGVVQAVTFSTTPYGQVRQVG